VLKLILGYLVICILDINNLSCLKFAVIKIFDLIYQYINKYNGRNKFPNINMYEQYNIACLQYMRTLYMYHIHMSTHTLSLPKSITKDFRYLWLPCGIFCISKHFVTMQDLKFSQCSCWSFKASGKWCCVNGWVVSDVLQDYNVFIIRVMQSFERKNEGTIILQSVGKYSSSNITS